MDQLIRFSVWNIIHINFFGNSDKEKELLPTQKYIIIEGSQDIVLSQPTMEKSQSADILNRKFRDLPPEELQYKDDDISRYLCICATVISYYIL